MTLFRWKHWLLGACFLTIYETGHSAAPVVSYDGRNLSLTAENQSFGQVMNLLQQRTGLEFEIPSELQGLRLPMVEIQRLSVREALLKLLEGSNYDYILVAMPGDPDRIQKLLIPGKSSKISGVSTAFRATNRPAMEDPFGGGAETTAEDNSNASEPPVINAQPGQAQPGQPQQGAPGVQPIPGNPTQPIQPGSLVPQQQQQQQQNQPQGLQPFNPFYNQNNRRTPY
jgi:hypothetical protein